MKKACGFLLLLPAFFSFGQNGGKLTVAQEYVLNELIEKVPSVVDQEFRGRKIDYYCDSTVHYAHRDSNTVIRTEYLKVDFSFPQDRAGAAAAYALEGGGKVIVEEFDSDSEFTGGALLRIGEFASGRIVRGATTYDTLRTESHYSYSSEGVLQQIQIVSGGEVKAVISWDYPDDLIANSTLVVPDQPQASVTNLLHFYPSGKIRTNESYDDKGALVNVITYVYDARNRLIEERAPQSVKTYAYADNDSIVRTVRIIRKDTTTCDCTFSGTVKSCVFIDKTTTGSFQKTTFNKQGKPVTYTVMEASDGYGAGSEQTEYTYTRSGKPLSVVTRYGEDEGTTAHVWQYSKDENEWVERHYVNGYPISVRYVVHRY